jgi:hypothetical protein
MGIETNLNQSPYFDDFNENKNFHRVLFRPGYAVQARELTQLQTILQNQVERFANEILVDGTVVSGVGLKTEKIDYVKLKDKDANNRVLLLGDFYSGGAVANAIVVGETTGMNAQLIDVVDGSETAGAANGTFLTLFVKYTNSGSNNTTRAFSNNEVLNVRWRANSSFIVAANTIATGATGEGFRASVSDGIIYHKGNFVRVAPQSIIVDNYTTSPTKNVGFETRESIINSNQDSSLLDNATGSTNFSAPGANRLKLTPTLAVRDAGTANTTTFFTIAKIENGEVAQKFTDTTYSEIGDYIAQQMYDTHGHYAVEPFGVRVREHLKDSGNLGRYENGDRLKLAIEVEKGVGYVQGKRVELTRAESEIDKATDYEVKDARVIGQRIGNYVYANEVVGTWDFQGLREVSLRSAQQNGISGLNFGAQSALGSEIGTARVRGVQYHSGTKGTAQGQFRIYLFDVQMNSGQSFSNVRGLYINNTSGPKSMADIVLEADGSAKLQEPGLNTLVYPFTQSGTKTLKDADNNVDTQFVFRTEQTVNFASDGTSSVSANTAHAGGTETLYDQGPSQVEERNLIVVSKSAVTSGNHTGTISAFSGNTITGSGTDFQEDYTIGEIIQISDGANTINARITNTPGATTINVADDIGYTRSGVSLTHKTSYPTGYIFDMNSNGSFSSTSTTHSINLNRTFNTNFNASVYFNVLRTSAVQTAKTVNKDKYVHINTGTHSAGANGPWCLGVSDAFKLVAVYQGSNTGVTTSSTDVTSNFELDSGMKDAMYDNAYLRLKSDSTLDVSNSGLLVKFHYFGRDRSNGIGFLSVDSYPIDDTLASNTAAIQTQEIPIFVSPTSGRSYDLRDSVDFRPIRTNTITPSANAVAVQTPSITNPDANTAFNIDADGAYMPTPDENFQTDVQFYLPRRDRIVMTKEGVVNVVKGIPSIIPKTPPEVGGAMTLAILDIPVYPSLSPYVARTAKRADYQVRVSLSNNRRYTMKDLRTMENRVKNLEYYSSLSMLEASAKNKQIFGTTGLDRFKNGFLVDNFDGHNVADTLKKGYRAAIDRNRSQLRPTFDRTDVSMSKDVALTSSNITQVGDLALLNYTESTFIDQRFASKQRNPVQELTFNWTGEVILNPSMDNTNDITTLPDIQIDFDGMYTAIEQIATETGITGIDWGAWRTVDTRSESESTVSTRRRGGNGTTTTTTTVTTTQEDQIRRGIQTSISPSNETFTIGNFVENVAVRDFMRSRLIQFTGTRMKPNTRVYPYFDEELVTGYCTPTNSSFANTASEGSALTTDSAGNVYGVFRIPNDSNLKFRVGTRRFQLLDIANTQTQSSLITTSAHGDYTSIGLDITQRGSSLNIKTPQFSKARVSDTRTLTNVVTQSRSRTEWRDDGGGGDPLSQTFYVSAGSSEGIFITKLDLYFAKKSSTYPVTVQIREVENGYPTDTIVPLGSKTLQPASVNVDAVDGTDATTFTFDSPVYLQNNREYAITILPGGNSDEYALWVGELGGTDVSTNELIYKQPSSGIMFTSANDKAWSPIQSEDLKFKLYKAQFTTSTGTLYIENDDLDFFTYSTISGTFRNGEKVSNATNQRGFVKFVDTVNQRIYLENSTGGFSTSETITGAKSGATAVISSIDNQQLNTLVPKVPQIIYANTNVSWAARTSSSAGVISSTYESIDIGDENSFLDEAKAVYSKTNESGISAVSGSKKTLTLRATVTTTDPNVSPVFDTTRCNSIVLGNIINNDITDEHKEVGSSQARYITRPVELTDGNEAEDLKVFVTAWKPSGADVKVYARIHNPSDPEGIDDKDFTPLTQITASNTFSDSVDTSDLKEFEFGFSANTDGQGFLETANSHARLNTSNSEVVAYRSSDGSIYHTYKTFAIKIVMTSSGTNIVPLVNDMRAIALQK